MQVNIIKRNLIKQVKPLLIALPLSLLLGFGYCLITKNMSIVSYSEVLLVIGGVCGAIGGMGYVGGGNIGTINTMLVSRDSNPKINDNSSGGNINLTLLISGISTLLISYVIGTFR